MKQNIRIRKKKNMMPQTNSLALGNWSPLNRMTSGKKKKKKERQIKFKRFRIFYFF